MVIDKENYEKNLLKEMNEWIIYEGNNALIIYVQKQFQIKT